MPKGVLLVKLIEPPYAERYVRWCGRSGKNQLPLLPDQILICNQVFRKRFFIKSCKFECLQPFFMGCCPVSLTSVEMFPLTYYERGICCLIFFNASFQLSRIRLHTHKRRMHLHRILCTSVRCNSVPACNPKVSPDMPLTSLVVFTFHG